MSLNLGYALREGIIGLGRTRAATVATVSIVSVSLMLLGVFILFILNVRGAFSGLQDRMSVEVFVQAGQREAALQAIEDQLTRISDVQRVVLVTPEQAIEKFREDFGDDMVDLLGENPLPPSFQVYPSPGADVRSRLRRIATEAEAIQGVDEAIFHEKLAIVIERYYLIGVGAGIVLLGFVFFSTVFLVSNTLRLAILHQRRSIEIMRLVGATEAFIRRPYLILGMLQSGIGALIAATVLWALTRVIQYRFPAAPRNSETVILGMVGMGLVLGYLGSRRALTRYLIAGRRR